jgi:hypothetical protein
MLTNHNLLKGNLLKGGAHENPFTGSTSLRSASTTNIMTWGRSKGEGRGVVKKTKSTKGTMEPFRSWQALW